MPDQTNARLSSLQIILQQAQESCHVSGLALAIAFGDGPVHTLTVGHDHKGQPLAENSLFPIASITKLATALAILRLSDQSQLSVDDPLSRFVPDAAAATFGVTLKQLLTHTSGLPDFPDGAWTYDATLDVSVQAQACLRLAPTIPPGSHVTYTGAGYGLLGIVVERVTGQSFRDALNEVVIRPLHIEAYLGAEPPRQTVYVTDPTDEHAGASIEAWNSTFWRSLGEPWNGIVATPAATLGLIRAYRGVPEGFLAAETIQAATKDQTGGLGGGFAWRQWSSIAWGLGPWIVTHDANMFDGAHLNPGTLSHAGISGCVTFADPTADVAWSIHATETAATGWLECGVPLVSNAVSAWA